MSQIITYAYAYVHGSVTLCATCVSRLPDWVPVLGRVEHGQREGLCDGCETEAAL